MQKSYMQMRASHPTKKLQAQKFGLPPKICSGEKIKKIKRG